jgi:Spy/CpxP family protein refolding chaperone
MTPEQRQARMAEHFAKREAELHAALKLSPAQEPAWNAFVAATRPAPHEHGDRAEWASLSAPARLQKMIDMSKQRTSMMEAHLSALNTFYSTLNPEQKRLMDQHTMHSDDGHGEHHWHGMRHETGAQG